MATSARNGSLDRSRLLSTSYKVVLDTLAYDRLVLMNLCATDPRYLRQREQNNTDTCASHMYVHHTIELLLDALRKMSNRVGDIYRRYIEVYHHVANIVTVCIHVEYASTMMLLQRTEHALRYYETIVRHRYLHADESLKYIGMLLVPPRTHVHDTFAVLDIDVVNDIQHWYRLEYTYATY